MPQTDHASSRDIDWNKPEVPKVDGVSCMQCNRVHRRDSDKYITIYGNVSSGSDDMLIDDNVDNDNRVVGAIALCKRCIWLTFKLDSP